MRFLRQKFSKLSRRQFVFIGIVVALAVIIPQLTWAADVLSNAKDSIGNAIYTVLANVVFALVVAVSKLTSVILYILLIVARYNTFLGAPVVNQAWPIVRDLMNMLFIIALLVIAAGTVLRLQNYRYNRLLGKLVIMAILVNFSKFIAVFLLQFAQVVMITFVNAFRDAAYANFTNALGLSSVMQFADKPSSWFDANGSAYQIFITLVAGLAMMVIALVVTLAITVILFVRIIALWILIILSPMAYALRILPQTEGLAQKWWKEFTKYAVVGPVLAFFLWAALAVVSSSSCKGLAGCEGKNPLSDADQTVKTQTAEAISDTNTLTKDFISDVLSIDRLMTFIVVIIFLMFGLKYAQESGTAGAKFAGQVAAGGFAVGAAVTGLNAVRDRTLAPIQGYLKQRSARRDEAVRDRTVALGARVDQGLSATVGRIGKGRAAVTGAAGAATRAVLSGRFGEIGTDAGTAARLGLQQGTKGYRQAQGRVSQWREATVAKEQKEKRMEFASDADLAQMMQTGGMNTRVAAGEIAAKRGRLNAAQAQRMSADLESVSPEQARNFRKTVYARQQDVALEAFHNNLATPADEESLLQAIDRQEASQGILKSRLLLNNPANSESGPNALAGRMGQRLQEMHQQKGTLEKMGEGMTDQVRDLLYSNITIADTVDEDDRRKIANSTGALHRAFINSGGMMVASLDNYLSRHAQKASEVMSETAINDDGLYDRLVANNNFRASHFTTMANRSGAMQRRVNESTDRAYNRDVTTRGGEVMVDGGVGSGFDEQQKIRTIKGLVNRGNFSAATAAGAPAGSPPLVPIEYFRDIGSADPVRQAAADRALGTIVAQAEGGQLGRIAQWNQYRNNAAAAAAINVNIAQNIRYDQAGNLSASDINLARDAFSSLPPGSPLRTVYEHNPLTANLF